MVKNMQQTFLERPFQTWLLLMLNYVLAMFGLQAVSMDADLVQQGWRQIPDGHQSFDPALSEYFRKQGMRNGKHINLAVSYSVVARWNASNKRRGQAEWTYGSDRHYADKYTDVDRKTWGQHMDDLAKLGLVVVSQMKGKPAYKAVEYQILNDQLSFVHAPGAGRDAQKVARDAQGYGHDAHPITESSKTEAFEKRNYQKPSPTPARAADADSDIVQPAQSFDDKKAELPEVRPATAADEGEDELLSQQVQPANLPRPIPPSSAAPPLPDETTEQDAEVEALRAFFTADSAEQVRGLIAQYGIDKIYATINATKGKPNVDNPPGLVKVTLAKGVGGAWAYPKLPKAPREDDHARDPVSMAEWLAQRQAS